MLDRYGRQQGVPLSPRVVSSHDVSYGVKKIRGVPYTVMITPSNTEMLRLYKWCYGLIPLSIAYVPFSILMPESDISFYIFLLAVMSIIIPMLRHSYWRLTAGSHYVVYNKKEVVFVRLLWRTRIPWSDVRKFYTVEPESMPPEWARYPAFYTVICSRKYRSNVSMNVFTYNASLEENRKRIHEVCRKKSIVVSETDMPNSIYEEPKDKKV